MRKIIKSIFFIGFLVIPFISCMSGISDITNICANENATDECMPHSDSEYQKLIVGTWSLNSLSLVNNSYALTMQYGATGMLTLTMYDTNNELYNSAYGYFDIKNNQVAATFYSESNSSVGLANGNPFHAELVCANSQQYIVKFHGAEFIFNKVP